MQYSVYLARRLLVSVVVLIGLSIIIFLISRVIPGDPARMALGPLATEEQVEKLREQFGLNDPIVVQYGNYLMGLAAGDFGKSLLTERNVRNDLAAFFPATLELVLCTILLVVTFGVIFGALSARHKDTWIDNGLRILSMGGVVTPSFFAAILLQLIFGYYLNVLPVFGRLSPDISFDGGPTGLVLVDALVRGNLPVWKDALLHMILPAVSLSLAGIGQVTRITRASMIDVSSRDFVRAQRSYGIAEVLLTFKYMLKPSFIPSLTILGLTFASLLGNAFLVEMVFSWPGMATYGIRAMLQKDFNAMVGVVMVIGLFFVAVNFFVDLLAGYVDPRLRVRGASTT